MATGSALFDTNILIDLFSGRSEAKLAIETWPPQNRNQPHYMDGVDGGSKKISSGISHTRCARRF